MAYYNWRPYVPVAERRRRALKSMEKMRRKGKDVQPIEIDGRKIATTFWGEAWCRHIESLGEYANRLPRGRTYVRNGSVCHLAIERSRVRAQVIGSSMYTVDIKIDALAPATWKTVKQRCSGQIGSLLELLQGRLSGSVMKVVTDPRKGLFPQPGEIHLDCSCPDWAVLCKHVAAVLYGVGARLDHQPELLFLLRGVNHEDLVAVRPDEAVARATRSGGRRRTVASADLAGVFGIDLDTGETSEQAAPPTPARRSPRRKKPARAAAPARRAPRVVKKKKTARAKKKTTTRKTTKKKTKASATRKRPARSAPAKVTKKKAPARRPAAKSLARKAAAARPRRKVTTKSRAATTKVTRKIAKATPRRKTTVKKVAHTTKVTKKTSRKTPTAKRKTARSKTAS